MIEIHHLGYQFVNMGGIDVDRKEGSGDYLLIYFRCPVEVNLTGEYEKIPENTFVLYKKGHPQIYRKTDGHFINDWVHFDFSEEEDFFEKLKIPFNTLIRLPQSKPVTDMISDLYIEYFNVGESHQKIMDQKARALFHKFSDLYQFAQKNSPKKVKYLEEMIEIRKKIQNFECHPEGAEELARQMHISTSYFQHLYKEFFGIPVNYDIINGRIEHAAHLLNGTEHSITEIAAICGYESLEHFSRQFKKIKGCSPMKYRN